MLRASWIYKWVSPRSCWWGAVPKYSFQGCWPVFKATVSGWRILQVTPEGSPELPPSLDYHSSAWKEFIEKFPRPGEKQSYSPPTGCLPCTITACAWPHVQAISPGALASRGFFGRIHQVICISCLEKLYLGHQAVREEKLISHPAPSLLQPAAGRDHLRHAKDTELVCCWDPGCCSNQSAKMILQHFLWCILLLSTFFKAQISPDKYLQKPKEKIDWCYRHCSRELLITIHKVFMNKFIYYLSSSSTAYTLSCTITCWRKQYAAWKWKQFDLIIYTITATLN